MKTQNEQVRHYASKSDYLKKEKSSSVPSKRAKEVGSTPKKDKSSEVSLSDKSKELAKDLKDVSKKDLKPMVPKAAPGSLAAAKGTPELDKIREKAKNFVNKPAIIFITGAEVPLIGGGIGLGAMAENMSGSELFNWDDKSDVLEEIFKRPPDKKIILVGEGLGGDTAVEVANELNDIENGFRKIDLLITLDSVGANNDIMPQNVKQNLNMIGNEGSLFNDGPNIARDASFTKVENEFFPADESSLQLKIFSKIQDALGKGKVT